MKKYNVYVEIPMAFEVEAPSETDAKKIIEKQLVDSGQIKPCSPTRIQVAELVEINED